MNLNYENKKIKEGFHYIIGCDEVGRGCLAGPVVAGAVILKLAEDEMVNQNSWFHQIRDSKLLSAKKRKELESKIKENSIAWAVGQVEANEIDEINIHQATLKAVRIAVEKILNLVSSETVLYHSGLTLPAVALCEGWDLESGNIDSRASGNDKNTKASKEMFLAIDGKFIIPKFHVEQEAVVDGDNKIISIAAASIVAKVYRDELMGELELKYPKYNFAKHKGYGTLHHRKAILQNGLSDIHRKTFCKNLL